jgi:hypothetical protein
MRNRKKVCLLLGVLGMLPACGGVSESTSASAGASSVGGATSGAGATSDAGATSAGSAPAVGGATSAGGAPAAGGVGHAGGSSNVLGGGAGTSGGSVGGASASAGRGGGTSPNELPGTSVLGQLSNSDLAELCAETNAAPAISMAASGACLNVALSSTAATFPYSDVEAKFVCHTIYDACVAQGQPQGACPTFTATCSATVAEYRACVNDFSSAYAHGFSALPSCDAVTVAVLERTVLDFPADPPEPASCSSLDEKCPEAASGGQ